MKAKNENDDRMLFQEVVMPLASYVGFHRIFQLFPAIFLLLLSKDHVYCFGSAISSAKGDVKNADAEIENILKQRGLMKFITHNFP